MVVKKLLLSLNLRLSDLFLAIGFIPISIFLIFGQLYMQYPNPDDVELSFPFAIAMFVILLISWGIYLYLENKAGNKVDRRINILFAFLLLIGILGILIQSRNYEMDLYLIDGSQAHLSLTISNTHYFFFIFEIISILLFVYIGLFVLPKRFKTLKMIKMLGYLVFLLCFVLIIYSYIWEADKYVLFFESLKKYDFYAMKECNIQGFILNSNAYGMTLMIGVMFCLMCHAMKSRWYYYLFSLVFFINMLFSCCRTSIILSIIMFLIYICFNCKIRKNKLNIIFLCIVFSIITLIAIFVCVVYFANGIIFGNLYILIKNITSNKNQVDLREWIWFNTYQIIAHTSPVSFLFGSGFGIMNLVLMRINFMNPYAFQFSFPTHSGFLNLLAEGGFLYLFTFLLLLGYAASIFKKCYKKQALLAITIAFGALAFSFYSLIETIHYLVYPFIFLLLVFKDAEIKNI